MKIDWGKSIILSIGLTVGLSAIMYGFRQCSTNYNQAPSNIYKTENNTYKGLEKLVK